MVHSSLALPSSEPISARDLSTNMKEFAARTASFIADHMVSNGRLGEREYYAHAFAAWLFAQCGPGFDASRRHALELVNANADRLDPSLPTKFHWEFVRFALEQTTRLPGGLSPYKTVREAIGAERFAYTRVANWTMLRATVRIMSPGILQRSLGVIESSIALAYFQKREGFIEDTKGSPTAQYHAFSTALLGLQMLESRIVQKVHRTRFELAVGALERLTFSSGEMNVLGRGQNQSFGYAAATLAFGLAAIILRQPKFIGLANRVFSRVSAFQRDDGSIPLSLRTDEVCRGEIVDLANHAFLGWYCYNNYFDYMTFTGALTALCSNLLSDVDIQADGEWSKDETMDRTSDGIRKLKTRSFEAIIVPPGRVLSDSMPLPFVESHGRQPLPCYGGETYGNSLHRTEDLPLPRIVMPDGRSNVLFSPGGYRWIEEDTFEGIGDGWRLKRRIVVTASGFDVLDEVALDHRWIGSTLLHSRVLLYDGQCRVEAPNRLLSDTITVRSDTPFLREDERRWSSRGALIAFSVPRPLLTANDLLIATKLSFDVSNFDDDQPLSGPLEEDN